MIKIILLLLHCILFILSNGLEHEKFEYKDHEYMFSYPTKGNWFKAVRYCRFLGYNLVEVNSKEINENVLEIINKPIYKNITYKSVWTGGTDLGEKNKGDFYWVTSGQEFNYTNFRSGEPNNLGGNEHCIELRDDHEFHFNDNDCSYANYFICQKLIKNKHCKNDDFIVEIIKT